MNMINSLKTNAIGIGAFAALTSAIIASTYVSTKEPIEKNIKQQKSAKLYQIVNKELIDNDLLQSTLTIDGTALGYANKITAYAAKKDGKVKTIIFPVLTPQGYSGNISLLIGIERDSSVAGVRVVTHKETPGLGDKLELKKSPWILSFNGKNKESNTAWAVKKDGGDFDQFTGATITPRAVVNAVGNTIDYYRNNQKALIEAAEHSGEENNDN